MTIPLRLRQNITLLLLIGLTIVGTQFGYLWIHEDWVTYRHAQDKYKEKKWSEAAVLYEKSFDMGLKHPEGLLRWAQTYIEMKQFSKAKDLYRQYLNVKPDDLQALKGYAGLLTANGEFDEAEKIYQKLLKKDGQNH